MHEHIPIVLPFCWLQVYRFSNRINSISNCLQLDYAFEDYAKARGSDVGVIVFAVSLEECLGRVRRRTDHPTLSSGGKSDHVVYSMAQSFAFPDRTEGFQFCRVIRNSVDVDRVLGEVLEAKGV